MKTTVLRYHVIFRKEGKNYIADVPTLGISDFGSSLDSAKKHVQKAIECHIDGLVKTNTEVPAPDTNDYFLSTTEVNISGPLHFAN